MRKGMRLTGTVLLVIVLLLTSVGVASAAPRDPFRGVWYAVDVGTDYSNMKIVFGGSHGTRHIVWQDDYWSICPDGGPGVGRGTGVLDGADANVLHASIDVYCGRSFAGNFLMEFVYDPYTNTMDNIVNGGGPGSVTWHR